MSQVLCPILIGRDDELAALEGALQAARAGRGALIVVSGEAGIGKSRLTAELAARARAQVTTGTGRAVESASQLALRPVGEALHAIVREQGAPRDADLAPFHRVLAPLVPPWAGEEPSAAEPSLVLLEGIHRLLRAIAKDKGLVLILEDLHWADPDTLAVLEYLADNIVSEHILCVCTERSGVAGPAADFIARLVGRRAAARIHLDPLPESSVEAMARASLDAESVPAAVLGALRRRAEGVPFLIEEMLSAFLAAGGRPEAGAEWWVTSRIAGSLPPSFRDLVHERLSSLDPTARDAVNAASILGRTFDWTLLGPILSLERAEVLAAMEAAVGAQVLVGAGEADPDAFSFRHALMREAVLAEMLPPERAERSHRAAEAIEDHRPGLPGEWCERAAELREQAGDRVGACRLLQESARRALARGALGSAESSLRRARALAEGDYVLWMGVYTVLCDVLGRAGKTEELISISRDLVGEWERAMRHAPSISLARMLPAARRAQVHLHAARAALVGGDLAFARQSLETARAAAPDHDVSLARAVAIEAAADRADGNLLAAETKGGAALADAERLRLGDLACEALDIIGRAQAERGDLDAANATFERLLNASEQDGASVWAIRALEELGALASLRTGSATLLDQARARAVDAGAVSSLAAIEIDLGRHEADGGHFAEAWRYLESALDACRRFALSLTTDAMLAQTELLALQGRSADMKRSIEKVRAVTGDRPEIAAAAGDVRAVGALVEEDLDGARALLDETASVRARWRHGVPRTAGLRVLLHAAAGEKLSEDHDVRGNGLLDGYRSYAEAVLLGRSGKAEAAVEAMARADSVMPPGWRRHHARRIVAEAALADGWGDPGTLARDALGFFDGRMPRVADACKRLMRRSGVAVPRAGRGESAVPAALADLGVTSREMDVLLLVAEGLSNHEIAERLFLSPRTVETHVKSLMRKTATGTRALLIALAAHHIP